MKYWEKIIYFPTNERAGTVLELKQMISGSDFHLKFNNAWTFFQFFYFRNQ